MFFIESYERDTYKQSLDIYNKLSNREKDLVAPRGRFVDSPNIAVRVSTYKGFCEVYTMDEDDIGFITIEVLPKYRGQSVSDELLHEAIKRSKEYGLKKLRYKMDKSNKPSMDLAKQNGFKLDYKIKDEVFYKMILS